MSTKTDPAYKPDTPVPALGATITINGVEYRVHQDCREAREQFERWLRTQALSVLDSMLVAKEIAPDEYQVRRGETFKDFQRRLYAYGSLAFMTAAGTHDGIVRSMLIRLGLAKENPVVAPAAVEEWVEQVGWTVANQVMQLADAFHPKSDTPAAGQS